MSLLCLEILIYHHILPATPAGRAWRTCLIPHHCQVKSLENETRPPHVLQRDNGQELLDLVFNDFDPTPGSLHATPSFFSLLQVLPKLLPLLVSFLDVPFLVL